MTTFDGGDPIAILHSLFAFVAEFESRQILEVQACLINPCFLKGKFLDYFLAAITASSYCRLCYWQGYVNYFLSTYPSTTYIRNKVMRFKDLKQFTHIAKVEFGSRVNEIKY